MTEQKKSRVIGFFVSIASGGFAGLIATMLHRIGINALLPYGFILAMLFLFACGVTVRSYISKSSVYIFSLACTFMTYFLSTGLHGDVLVVAATIPGEKPWSGFLGWVLLAGSFFLPFIAIFLPERFFSSCKYLPTFKTHDKDLDFMLRLVTATDIILTRAFLGGKYRTDTKEDGTPVTEVDKAVEAYIRDEIAKEFPHDAVLGEEFALVESALQKADSTSKRRWIIDPIDGTKNFIRGVPIFATLIALEEMQPDGTLKVVKSVVSAPLLKRRWWGDGQRAFSQFDQEKPRKIQVSEVSRLEDATLSISSRGGWLQDSKNLQYFDALSSEVKRVREFGDFYSYMLLAEGAVDIATEPDLELYDIAALIPIVEGAGGKITDIYGEQWNSVEGIKSALASTRNLEVNHVQSD